MRLEPGECGVTEESGRGRVRPRIAGTLQAIATVSLLLLGAAGASPMGGGNASGSTSVNSTPSGRATTAGLNLPTYSVHVDPYTTDPANPSSYYNFFWNAFTSPNTPTLAPNGGGGRVLPITEQPEWWVLFSRYWDPTFPNTLGWGVALNFHTVAGDKGWGGASSPVRLDYSGDTGTLQVATGGTYDSSIDNWHNVEWRDFPVPIVLGAWQDYVLHLRWSYGTTGIAQLWVNGAKVVDYIGPVGYGSGNNEANWEKYVSLWQGFYRPGYPNVDNTQVARFVDTANRVGQTYAGAIADTPTLYASWGSVPVDGAPAGTLSSSKDLLASSTHSTFLYPTNP